ncbi:MAG: PorV/PorQ family protein [FCB group bacterium]|nr:PorV/PorQ family protein [FCB group bacterium]
MIRCSYFRRLLMAAFILMVTPTTAQLVKQVSKVGSTAATFLEIGVGARARGVGDAFVSVANDVSALYWNPAGITALEKPEAQFYHSPWIAGIRFNFAGAVIPLNQYGSLGLFYTGVGMDDEPVRTIFYPEGTGEYYQASSLSFGLTYSRRLTDHFSFGVTVKHIQEQIWHMTATSTALDVGTLFRSRNRGFRLGMSISNFGNKMKLEGRDTQQKVDIDEQKAGNNDRIDAHLDTWAWQLPLLMRVGLSKDIQIGKTQKIVVAVDAVHPNDNTEYVNAGAEYWLGKMLVIRAGQNNLLLKDRQSGWTFGFGLRTNFYGRANIALDYAARSMGVFEIINGYSLNIIF